MKPGRRRWKLRVSVLYSFRVQAATAHFSLCFTAAPPCPLSKPPSPLIINTLHVCPRFLMSWTNSLVLTDFLEFLNFRDGCLRLKEIVIAVVICYHRVQERVWVCGSVCVCACLFMEVFDVCVASAAPGVSGKALGWCRDGQTHHQAVQTDRVAGISRWGVRRQPGNSKYPRTGQASGRRRKMFSSVMLMKSHVNACSWIIEIQIFGQIFTNPSWNDPIWIWFGFLAVCGIN